MKRSVLAGLCAGFLLVFLSGCSDDDDDDVVIAEDVASESVLRMIHAAPGAPQVDVRLDGTPVFEFLEYGESSGYYSGPAGSYAVTVVPSGEEDALAGLDDFALEPGMVTTIFIVGGPSGVVLAATGDLSEYDVDLADVRLVHAVPDAPDIDVAAGSEGEVPLFSGVEYTGVTDYLKLDPGRYDLAVAASGDAEPMEIFGGAEFEAGGAYTAALLGTLAPDDEFGLILRVYTDDLIGRSYEDLAPAEKP